MEQVSARLQEIDWADIGLTWLGALLILFIGLRLVRWAAQLSEKAMTRAQFELTAVMFLRKVVYVILLVALILAVLQVIGVPMTSMIAVLGAAGLAIGLALKDSLSNIASGVMLVSLKPFRAGDVVTIAGETGKVESVSIFQTRLRGVDNQTIVLPNSLITSDAIINLTPDTRRRIELVIGIGYHDDIQAARAAVLAVMAADPRVLEDPAPDVLVYALADNSVSLGIRCHVRNDDHFVTRCELTERIKHAFDGIGVSIPFPQRDVHMIHTVADDVPGGAASGNYRLARTTSRPGAGRTGAKPATTDAPDTVSLDDPRHHPTTDPQ